MIPIGEISAEICRGISWLLTDIDDTLTEGGMLTSSAYASLWSLARGGVKAVAVTGRPAGWCDHIARMWPVAGVVGENGAFSYAYDRTEQKMRRVYSMPPEEMARNHGVLERAASRVLREVPGTAIAADQPFRISDCAIDFREDVPPLGDAEIDGICRILSEEGVRFKVSSIHVNFWIGGFDKLTRIRGFIEEEGGSPWEEERARIAFIGDSPNDEPMFAAVPHSIGVANVRRFLARMKTPPRYVTEAESARGFAEAVSIILEKRSEAR